MRPVFPARRNSLPLLATALVWSAALCGAPPAAAMGDLRVLGPGSASDPPRIDILRSDAEGMDLEFSLPALTVREIDVDGETFQEVGIPGGATVGEAGSPGLPAYGRLIALPEGAEARVAGSVLEQEDLPAFHLYPVQGREGEPFAIDRAAYARRGFGETPLARASSAGSVRGVRVAPLAFSPVRYDPSSGTLRVARRIRIRVSFAGGTGRFESPGKLTPSFDRIYRALLVNYDQIGGGDKQIQDGSWLLVCVDDPEVMSRLQPLVDWRKRQGRHVRVVTTAETGPSAYEILTYIQYAYDQWEHPPEYIVLVGDAAGPYSVPTWFETVSGLHGEGDHPYTQLEGYDILADAHVGRLSFNTLDELSTIVAKTVNYESNPHTAETDWFTRACLVGDSYDSGRSTIQVQQWIKTRLLQIGYTQIDTVFSGDYVSQMRAALNRGDTIFCYRGFAGFSGWTNSLTYALTNYDKLFFAVTCTCGTGDFFSSTARSEAFLRAGTAAQPKAGIGAIATATGLTHTRFNNCFTFGVFQGLLYEDQEEMGAADTRGKFELYSQYQADNPNAVIEFSYWNNLMGDPACRIWTAAPEAMKVEAPASIPVGTNSVRVHVAGPGGIPVADARVCLYRSPEEPVTGGTDAAGDCELAVNAAEPGTVELTVTAYNHVPFLADIAVVPSPVFVGYASSSVDDDDLGGSQGNGDGFINPGETIELGVRLRNSGSEPAPDVTAVLSGADPYVALLDTTEVYGTIEAGAETEGPGPYRFTVGRGAPEGYTIRLGLDASSGSDRWHSRIDLPVRSADLRAVADRIYDQDDGRLDPGETRDLSVLLRNEGSVAAAGASAILRSLTPRVWVPDSLAAYGAIACGDSLENMADHFTLRADPAVYPGTVARLQLVTTFNGGVLDTTFTTLIVGSRTTSDPIGPDGHGYYAFDDTDAAYPERPVYDWIEIAANMGGGGSQVVLGDYWDEADASRALDLPFAFRFYGQDFDRATICSNGWLAMGDTYLTDYRNWSIPGAGAPQNLIAPFWDDLREVAATGGHVYQEFDAPNHRWIVEWSRMHNAVMDAVETFEVILYDPAWYRTWTGDGIIVFQYNEISNVDPVDGYATVGIQNATHTDGILYTYFGRYPAGAAPLAAGRAIRILTAGTSPAGAPASPPAPALSWLGPARPNPFTTGTVLGFCVARAGSARLAVFDAAGRRVRVLLDGAAAPGPGSARWDGCDETGRPVPSGIYLYRLESQGATEAGKMIKIE